MIKNIFLKIQQLDFNYNLVEPDDNFPVKDISLIHYAREYDICYLDKNLPHLVKDKKNITLICPYDFDDTNENIRYIKTDFPKLVFYYISHLFGDNKEFNIDEELSSKYPGAFIGEGCIIGENTEIHPGAIIRENTKIGNNTTIESGCVIGSTGLLWTLDHRTNKKVMLTLTGNTEIGNDCYICSNVSVVRGSCNETTKIKDGVMIAPGSAIGHGGFIGKNTHIANNVTLGGGVKIEQSAFLGSGCTVQPALIVGERAVLGSGTILTTNAKPNGVYLGIPGKYIKERTKNLKGIPCE